MAVAGQSVMGSCNPMIVFFNNPNPKTIPVVVCYQRPPKRRIEIDPEIILNRQKGAVGIIGNHQSFQFSRANPVDVVDDEGDDNGFSAEEWRREMREREVREILKEIEDMKELERRAEELQGKMGKSAEAALAEETEEEKRQRVRKELEKLAKEQAERREQAKLMFDLGQKAYGRGSYGRATEVFEAALTVVPGQTLLGGEIQIWLAMTYDANNRHRDCIALYQELERRHPSLSIRRQAAGLRYILQAPKLKISDEERLTIPLIGSSYDNYASYWPDKYKDKPKKGYEAKTSQVNSTKDYLGDFLVFRAPKGWEDSRVFWLYLSACVGLVGLAFLQK